jgi:dienelactone hydrolase
MADIDRLADYQRFIFDDGRWSRPVFRRGAGPAVIIIHEIPGLHPRVVRFADHVAAAGMTVFLPSLFGKPGKPASAPYALSQMVTAICIRREFHLWAGAGSSPIVDWLRALARQVHAECGGKGVGAVGMCFTGGFALAMMTEPAVVAPVLSQPSQPIFGKGKAAAVDVSPAEIACAKRRFQDEDLSMIGLRFFGDPFVPDARFDALKAEFGDKFEAIELDPKDAFQGSGMAPHSVLTLHLDDRPGTPTKRAEQRVIEFFRQRVGAD